MKYDISHRTAYTYDSPVTASYGQLHQLPSDADGQRCIDRSITITPAPDTYRERVDFFGNRTAVFAIHRSHKELLVVSHSVVDTTGRFVEFGEYGDAAWEITRDALWSPAGTRTARSIDRGKRDYALESPLVPTLDAVAEYAAVSFPPGRLLGDAVMDLMHRVHEDFDYQPGSTLVDTPLAKVMTGRKGVCQDFAHVMLGGMRALGLAVSYVSGYLETAPPEGSDRLKGADQSHAWVGVYCGDDVWIGVDPTNDQLAGPRYMTTAYGRDYSDIPPLKGVIYTDAKENELTVEVDVVPI